MCNEAENMKRNCPSVKILDRNILPDAMGENCDTDIDGQRWAPKKAAGNTMGA